MGWSSLCIGRQSIWLSRELPVVTDAVVGGALEKGHERVSL